MQVKNMTVKVLAVLASLFFVSNSQALDFAIDTHAGLMGSGLGATVGLSDKLNLRLGVNSLEQGEDFSEDGVDYAVDLEFDNQYLLFDYHPFGGALHLTAGIFNNNNEINGNASATTSTTIGDPDTGEEITFSATGGINLGIAYEDTTATYIGIGFGNAVSNGGLGLSLDIGVVMTGDFVANVALDDDANAAALAVPGTTQQDIDAALAAEVTQVNDEFEGFDQFPLIQLGISYGF